MALVKLPITEDTVSEYPTFTAPLRVPFVFKRRFKREKKWQVSKDQLVQGSPLGGIANYGVMNLIKLPQPIQVSEKTEFSFTITPGENWQNVMVAAAGLVPDDGPWFDKWTGDTTYKQFLLACFYQNYLWPKDDDEEGKWYDDWHPFAEGQIIVPYLATEGFGYSVSGTDPEELAGEQDPLKILPDTYLKKKYAAFGDTGNRPVTFKLLARDYLGDMAIDQGETIDYEASYLALYTGNGPLAVDKFKIDATRPKQHAYKSWAWGSVSVDTHDADQLITWDDTMKSVGKGDDVKNGADGSALFYVPGQHFVIRGDHLCYQSLPAPIASCDAVVFKLGIWAAELPKNVAIAFVSSNDFDLGDDDSIAAVQADMIHLAGKEPEGETLDGFDQMAYGKLLPGAEGFGIVSGAGSYDGGTEYRIPGEKLKAGWDTILLSVTGNDGDVFFRNLMIMNFTT